VIIEIVTTDTTLATDLMGGSDDQVSIPGGATLTYKGGTIHETINYPETIIFILENVVGPVTTGIVSNWLFGKITGRAKKLRIQKREVRIVKEEIIRVIEEITTSEE